VKLYGRMAGAAMLFACVGCMTQQSYEGPRRPADEVAHISGDLRVTAGAPMSVILRKVDNHTLGFSESGVDVLPGQHRLLVDCLIRETSSTTRHSIDVDVVEGRRYKLVADFSPGLRGCESVRLEVRD
jgi:hypothetical protein